MVLDNANMEEEGPWYSGSCIGEKGVNDVSLWLCSVSQIHTRCNQEPQNSDINYSLVTLTLNGKYSEAQITNQTIPTFLKMLSKFYCASLFFWEKV